MVLQSEKPMWVVHIIVPNVNEMNVRNNCNIVRWSSVPNVNEMNVSNNCNIVRWSSVPNVNEIKTFQNII